MKPGQRANISLEDGKAVCYAICTPGELCVTAISDQEYSEKAAFAALYELAMDFIATYKANPEVIGAKVDLSITYKGIETILAKWQKPEESMHFLVYSSIDDKLLLIEKELQSVTELLPQLKELN